MVWRAMGNWCYLSRQLSAGWFSGFAGAAASGVCVFVCVCVRACVCVCTCVCVMLVVETLY